MNSADFNQLQIARFQLKLRAKQAASLPAYLGSMLRGAFGTALKNAVCVMNHRDCDRCLVLNSCIYPYLFETRAPQDSTLLKKHQQPPHPFILTPPLTSLNTTIVNNNKTNKPDNSNNSNNSKTSNYLQSHPQSLSQQRLDCKTDDELLFELLLMGRAIDYLPYIIYAVTEMARRGLGSQHAQFELKSVTQISQGNNHTEIYHGDNQQLSTTIKPDNLGDLIDERLSQLKSDNIKLNFLSPARIRVAGDLQIALDFQLLIRNLLRRISLLTAMHGTAPLTYNFAKLIDDAAPIRTTVSNLQWCEFERYSNRQQQKMKLGGIIGEVEYQSERLTDYLPLIAAGELLHVGATTSFGLGKYRIA